MPAKKKPTMLQRQRALRKQQQQTKQQSSRQLPPGKKGGSVDKPKTSKPNPPRTKQPVQQVRVRDLGSTKPKPMAGGSQRALPPGRQGGAMTRVAGAAGKAASTAAGLGGRMLGAAGTALMIPAAIKNIADVAERNRQWNAYKERMGLNKPQQSQGGSSSSSRRRTGQNNNTVSVRTDARGTRAGAASGTRTRSRNTAKPTSALEGRVSNANINDLRRGQEEARKAQLERANRGQRSTTQSGGGSSQSRSSSSSRSMPSAVTRSTAPARDAGMKNQDPKYRGNLFEKTFGYKKGEAPDQQKSRFKSVDNKFGQDSGYEPKTKVDGSKYADKKPDMKKVKEYDRLRRRYYD